MVGEPRRRDASDLLAAALARRRAAVLAVVLVEADHLAEEVERRDLLARGAAARHQLAEQDRVAVVARALEPGVTRQVQVPVQRGRDRRALLALRAQPAVQVRLVPERPQVDVRELLADRLGEQPVFLAARAVRAAPAAPLRGPVGREADDAHIGTHPAGADRVDHRPVVAPLVAGRIAGVEAGWLAPAVGRDLLPGEADLDHVRAQRRELVERRGGVVAQMNIVLQDGHLLGRGFGRGHGQQREKNGSDDCQSFHRVERVGFERANAGNQANAPRRRPPAFP